VHQTAIELLEHHCKALDYMSEPMRNTITQFSANENKATAIAIRATIQVLRNMPVVVLDSSAEVAVDKFYHFQPMNTCPIGVKVQLLGDGGVAVYSQYNGKDTFWQGWAPVPTKKKE
jgi:hypothetical protein